MRLRGEGMMLKHIKRVAARYPLKMKDGTWKKLTNWWLEERAAASFEAMRNEFLRRYGDDLLVVSMGRTHAEQVHLYAIKPKLAARPGRSWHEGGCAVDFCMAHAIESTGSQATFERYAEEFGWKRTVSYERWHFEYHSFIPRARGAPWAIAYVGNNA